MKLSKLRSKIIRERGLPCFERLEKVDKNFYNWHVCHVCNNYVHGTCLSCQNSGKSVTSIGTVGDLWPTKVTFPLDVIDLEDEYGNIVKAWRVYRGLTVAEFASRLGIPVSEVEQIEGRGFEFVARG